jgi:perosamine synthetase
LISLHEPRFNSDDEKVVLETLRSTWVSTGGPFVDQFETEFAKYVGSKHAISVSNGTIALQLAVDVLRRMSEVDKPFDVLVPTLSFIATANAVSHANGTPILVDTAPNSVNISAAALESTITSRYQQSATGTWLNKASGNVLLCIMPAHIMGWTCDMKAIHRISRDHKIPVIDDAAEALGSHFLDGRHAGKGSLAATFSFNGNKILTTGGGGMIVTDDDQFAKLAKHLSTTAKTDGLRYVHDQVGYNYRMVNILAALGVSQLKRLDETLKQKQVIASTYKELLAKAHVPILEEPDTQTNNWIVNALFVSESDREKSLSGLMERKIQARPLWTPAHRLPFMTTQNTLGQSFPHADNMWRRALSLPSSAHLTLNEVKQVVDAIAESIS